MLASEPRAHTVVPGETLWEIAPAAAEPQFSNWPCAISSSQPTSCRQGKSLGGNGSQSRICVRYTVRRGDSLTGIARHFHVSVGELRKWDTLPHADLLHPGQQLIILSLTVRVRKKSDFRGRPVQVVA